MTARGSYAKGVARLEEILRVALAVFAREGYRGTSLREVAREVGVSLPGLMHYFASKEHLFAAILRVRDAVDSEEFAATGSQDAIEGLVAVMRHNSDVPGLVELYLTMAAAAGDPAHPARAFFVEHVAGVRRSLVEVVRERQAEGVVRAELDAEHVARIMIAIADGLQVQWSLDPSIDMGGDLERA
ncbi:TetR/AcrR family transcriptional regulator [Plantibacter sp. LMC-P-059a]|uniref:TetR/AcrR family transcriptional regulator n=1 Tax=Plantibacter sp. LMC-P-059a TaxID=3040297 RepID=UPI002550DB6E|nr:TetR/AcrR family transcriptional regulator [Plantibacter sp. LMC-P-059a]